MKTQRMLNRVALLALLIVSAAAQLSAQTKAKPAENALPDLTFSAIDGKNWSLHENIGGIVVLNFWATWCEPCRAEIPMLVKVSGEYEKRGLKVAGVSLDEGSTELIKKFIAEYKIDFPILIPESNSPFRRIENLPVTLLIDSAGRLAKKYTGAMPEKVLREDIEKLLTEADQSKPSKNTSSAN